MRGVVVLVCALSACGRVDFDPDARLDGGGTDGVAVDVPGAVWELAQVRGALAPTVPIDPTVAGNLLVVAVQSGSTMGATAVQDNVGTTFTVVPSTFAKDAMSAIQFWTATARSGATTITVSGSNIPTVVVWEVVGAQPIADNAALFDNGPLGTTATASVTTGQADTFIVAAMVVDNAVTGLAPGGPFVTDIPTNGNGWAHVPARNAPAATYTAQWTQSPAGSYCASVVAFKAQ